MRARTTGQCSPAAARATFLSRQDNFATRMFRACPRSPAGLARPSRQGPKKPTTLCRWRRDSYMNVWPAEPDFPHRAFSCAFSHVIAEPIWHPGCSLTFRPATGGVRGDPFARDCPQNPHRRHACGPVPPGRAAGLRVGADAEQAAPRRGGSSGCALRSGSRARRSGVGAGCASGVAARGDVRSPSVLDVSTRAPWHRHRRLGRRGRPATAGRARNTPGDARSVTLGRHASPDLDRSPSRLCRRHGCPPARPEDSPTRLAHARSPRGAHAPWPADEWGEACQDFEDTRASLRRPRLPPSPSPARHAPPTPRERPHLRSTRVTPRGC